MCEAHMASIKFRQLSNSLHFGLFFFFFFFRFFGFVSVLQIVWSFGNRARFACSPSHFLYNLPACTCAELARHFIIYVSSSLEYINS